MRIGISGLAINCNDFGGGERYLYFLLHYLSRMDELNEYFVFVTKKNKDRFFIDRNNFNAVVCGIGGDSVVERILYEQTVLPRLLKRHGIDVFHGPNNMIPLSAPCGSVMSIQSMLNFIMPECYKPLYKRACVGYVMKACARRADRIISVSGNNKEMIIRYLKAPEDKISVIYHGVEDDYRKGANPESIEACKKDLGISGRYLFSVANNYHHKNLEGLFKAFVYLKDRYDIPHKLVIAGNSGFSKERRAWLEKMKKIVPDFVHLGYIGHELLPYLHNGADAMIFSSQCESFGMPLVEAMACGVPIVASRIFAIPEVVKDAAILVNPYDYIEMGDAIYKVLTDNGVKSALVDRALARARDFSWEETARQTLDIYGQVFKKARAA